MLIIAFVCNKLRDMRNSSANLIYSGHIMPRRGWRMETHQHLYHELIVVLRGRASVCINGVSMTAGPGNLLFYRAGWAHEECSDDQDFVETLFFGFVWPDAPSDLPVRLLDRHGRICQLAQWVHEERIIQKPENQQAQNAFFNALLAEWIRLARHQEHPLQERIRNHIAASLRNRITLEDLAAVAGMSKFHFIRKYRQLTGCTPMDEVQGMRIERARELILTTNLPLKAIAARAGFRDVYHFSHAFKRRLGLTPSSLRHGR
jgi:AraC-like DNA-binding protein